MFDCLRKCILEKRKSLSLYHCTKIETFAVPPSQIYICGGFNGEESLQSGECYDPKTNQWTMIASMGTHRSGLGVVAYVGHVYVVSAGSNAFSFLNSFSKDLTQCLLLFTLKKAR